jgi:hypothetical protein
MEQTARTHHNGSSLVNGVFFVHQMARRYIPKKHNNAGCIVNTLRAATESQKVHFGHNFYWLEFGSPGLRQKRQIAQFRTAESFFRR